MLGRFVTRCWTGRIAILIAVIGLTPMSARADDGGVIQRGHDQASGHDHSFELSVSPGLVYLITEEQVAFGLHLHLVGEVSPRWSLGAGFERVFDDHAHNTISAVLLYRVTDSWTVVLAPGGTFSDKDPAAFDPSGHLETAYEFKFGDMHFGPSLELAVDPDDAHLTAGIHVGFGF